MRHLPILLTLLRLLLAPFVILLVFARAPGWTLVVCLTLAMVSDYLDGVIARAYQIATSFLRRFDSVADAVFYLTALWAIWVLHGDILSHHITGIGCVLALEVIRYVFDFVKFRKVASYHMWSAKCWQVSLFAAFVSLLGFGVSEPLFTVAIFLGILSDLEGLGASLVLRKPLTDVPSLVHAWRWRRDRPAPV